MEQWQIDELKKVSAEVRRLREGPAAYETEIDQLKGRIEVLEEEKRDILSALHEMILWWERFNAVQIPLLKKSVYLEDLNPKKEITVCSECLRACCWQGEVMCENGQYAGIVKKTVEELKTLGLEDPSWWEEGE